MKINNKVTQSIVSVKGLPLQEGTVVDATIIAVPSPTKNKDGQRDPQMHQVKKGNMWHFGMKAHIGVDAQSGITHSLVTKPANGNDVTQANALLHGEDKVALGDAGYYQGDAKRVDNQNCNVHWSVEMIPDKLKRLNLKKALGALIDTEILNKASFRAKVALPFHIIKNIFGLKKVRYKGLAKNKPQLFTLFELENLMVAKRRLKLLT